MSKQHAGKITLAVFSLLLAGCIVNTRQTLQPPQVPEALTVSADEKVALLAFAEGVQIYRRSP